MVTVEPLHAKAVNVLTITKMMIRSVILTTSAATIKTAVIWMSVKMTMTMAMISAIPTIFVVGIKTAAI